MEETITKIKTKRPHVSKTMGLAVVFLCFSIYEYFLVFYSYYRSLTAGQHDKPISHIFIYSVVGVSSAAVALIFASISLGRHPDTGTVADWWLTFLGFCITLATFGFILYRYMVELQVT